MWRNGLRFGSLVNISVSVLVEAPDNSQHVSFLKVVCQGEVSSYGPHVIHKIDFGLNTRKSR